MPVEQQHAKLAPSASSRWLACPGSIRLESKVKAQLNEDYDFGGSCAAKGTAAHALAEKCLLNGTDAGDYFGQTIDGFLVDADTVDAVQVYVDYCRALAPADMLAKKLVLRNVEESFKLTWLHPDIWGTNDFSAYNVMDHTLEVVDYKHGRGVVVEPDHNSQLMTYALGAMYGLWNGQTETTKKVISVYKMVESVRLTIVQPRAEHDDGVIRSWDTAPRELMFWATNVLRLGALETEESDAALNAGEHCRFCKAVAVCPERVKRNVEIAKVDFGKPVLPEPDQLKPEHMAKVLEVSKLLSDWAGQVKAFAQAQLEAGFVVPGFKLVKRRALRKWKPGVADQLELLLEDAAFTAPKLVTPAAAEKAATAAGIDPKIMADLWDKPDNGCTIAAEDDKRQAIAPAAIDDFDDSFLD